MAITDELRGFIEVEAPCYEVATLLAIANSIDEQHEREVADTRNDTLFRANEKDMGELGWIRLPKDADGEYIHIGDKVTCGASVWEVTGFRFAGGFWGICCTISNDQGGSGTNVYPPSELHHYRALTVEDVLREFMDEFNRDDTELCDGEIIERFAAKLRLAESEES